MARASAAHLASLSPDSYLLAEMTAESFELDGLPEQAEAEYRKAIAGAGADPRPAIAYGRFQCKLARFTDAIPILDDALRRDPNNVEAHSLAAEACLRTDHFTEAVPHLRAVLKARPNDTAARIDVARSLAREGNLKEAVAILEATPVDRDGRAHYILARLYRQMGRTEDSKRAMAFFERCRAGGCGPLAQSSARQ
jgi:predicted Zn-dependent protease